LHDKIEIKEFQTISNFYDEISEAPVIFVHVSNISFSGINTSYIERINLTVRNSLARFIRKGMNYSKNALMHSRAIDFFQAWYNFVKPHKSLRLMVNCGNKKWLQRTPAMAQKLTNHIWTLKELSAFRVPVQ